MGFIKTKLQLRDYVPAPSLPPPASRPPPHTHILIYCFCHGRLSVLKSCPLCRPYLKNVQYILMKLHVNTRGLLVLYRSPECWGYVKIRCYWEKKFKHSPRVEADNPLGSKFWGQQKGLITMVICCKPKTNLFNLWLYKTPGTKLWCQQKPLVTSVICYKFQKISLKSDFILFFFFFFFMILYMYIAPGQGWQALGDEILMQQEHLVTSVICCKFQRNLFEVWFYTFFFHGFTHIYSPRARTGSPQGSKVLMSKEMSCHFIHLLQV